MKFKLLRGIHSQREMVQPTEPCPDCDKGKALSDKKPCTSCKATGNRHVDKVYEAKDPKNNIIESKSDLELRFGNEKYQNIDRLLDGADDNAALRSQLVALEEENRKLRQELNIDPDFEKMSAKELREYARKENIEVDDTMKKDELVHAIESALTSA